MKAGRRRTAAWQGSSRVFLLSLLFAWSAPVPSVQPQESYAAPPPRVRYPINSTLLQEMDRCTRRARQRRAARWSFTVRLSGHRQQRPRARLPGSLPVTALREGLERQLRKTLTAQAESGRCSSHSDVHCREPRPHLIFRYPRVVLAVDGEPQAQP